MWIKRDLESFLSPWRGLECLLVLGPRQAGKSSLIRHVLEKSPNQYKTLDDLQFRNLAQNEPKLFLESMGNPKIIDEAQYSENLFPEIKLYIDNQRREQGSNLVSPLMAITGSNLSLIEARIHGILSGRVSTLWLHPLSYGEILSSALKIPLVEFFYKGGWPELYRNSQLETVSYLNDYIKTYLEKDVTQALGILKVGEFLTALKFMAGRSGTVLDMNALANDSGVKIPTLKNWIQMLEKLGILRLVYPWFNNLNKRLIKSPKLYFLDTGLLARLQGYTSPETFLVSPLVGAAFESLVLSEIVKTNDHNMRNWDLYYFRNKEKEEVDFVIKSQNKVLVLEAKLSMQSAEPIEIPLGAKKELKTEKIHIVTWGGERLKLSGRCEQIPFSMLSSFLLEELE